ncbi:hypothetical protein [Nostoc sp.]|uniref:hypothetical protein n=1 Tax=Nostoc sp. TaxID=1180 RepID=UPI002FFBA1EA
MVFIPITCEVAPELGACFNKPNFVQFHKELISRWTKIFTVIASDRVAMRLVGAASPRVEKQSNPSRKQIATLKDATA